MHHLCLGSLEDVTKQHLSEIYIIIIDTPYKKVAILVKYLVTIVFGKNLCSGS